MLKNLIRDLTLAVQAKTGATTAVLVWLGVVAVAAVFALAFLCLAAFEWLVLQVGSIYAGLIMAGVFVVIALFGLIVSALLRKRARERAILARAAKAHAPSWLLDPRLLGTAVQIGRTLGWQRIVPVALLGFMAAQWTREYQQRREGDR
jgi:Na+/proline symporter